MNELLVALRVILNFAPDRPLPGLNCVLMEVADERLFLYATNGHLMARVELDPSLLVGEGSPFFLNPKDLESAIEQLVGESEVTISVFGNDAMICGGSKVISTRRVEGDFSEFYRKFFAVVNPAASVILDLAQLTGAADACGSILAEYTGHGSAVEVRVQPVHWQEGNLNMALVSMKLSADLKRIKEVQVVIMGLVV